MGLGYFNVDGKANLALCSDLDSEDNDNYESDSSIIDSLSGLSSVKASLFSIYISNSVKIID